MDPVETMTGGSPLDTRCSPYLCCIAAVNDARFLAAGNAGRLSAFGFGALTVQSPAFLRYLEKLYS